MKSQDKTTENSTDAVEQREAIRQALEVIAIEGQGVQGLLDQVNGGFVRAVELIMACPSRVILTGIGKSGIVGQKISATFNSTGTPSFFLHPVEAMHGDLGMVCRQDVVLAISSSGETLELNTLLAGLAQRCAAIIAMTGRRDSPLARLADAVIDVHVDREACPLGLAPTASTTATMVMGDALAVVLLQRKKFKASDFRRNHPGGKLGERLRVAVAEVMLTGDRVPTAFPDDTLSHAIAVLNKKSLGSVVVVDQEQKVLGIITDGDIRRLVAKGGDFREKKPCDCMTPTPKTITPDLLAADALSIMQRHEITVLPVTDQAGRLVAILHLHDLLGKGEFRFLV